MTARITRIAPRALTAMIALLLMQARLHRLALVAGNTSAARSRYKQGKPWYAWEVAKPFPPGTLH